MWLTSMLRRRNSKSASRFQDRLPTNFRPSLESLDDRLVPSTLHVTNNQDFGTGSLRYEIAHANSSGKDTIVFDKNVTGTINLGSELYISSGVTIQGPGADRLMVTTNYNFGDPFGQSIRAFEVNASKPVVISGLTISDNGVSSEGGAILNHTTLTVSSCNLSNNFAGLSGGAIANHGNLTVNNCTLSSNYAANYGGAIYNASSMTVTSCTLSGNAAYEGGAIYNASSMAVTTCNLSSDNGQIGGGAVYNTGALTVSNSHFTGNTPDNIFGPYIDGGGNTFG